MASQAQQLRWKYIAAVIGEWMRCCLEAGASGEYGGQI